MPIFTRRILELLDDDEYLALQLALVENPQLGKVIRHSGGIRKLRRFAEGRGRRSGARVI